MAAVPVLESALVRLRPLRDEDLALLVRWYGDADVSHWLHHSEYLDVSDERVREKFGKAAGGPDEVRWVIEAADRAPIGWMRLVGIEARHRRAELAIMIGEKEHWSSGYGTAAINLALKHAFGELGLRRVWLVTDSDNERGIRCYEKCGFRREGVLRAHRVRYGEPLDMIAMGIVKEEWDRED